MAGKSKRANLRLKKKNKDRIWNRIRVYSKFLIAYNLEKHGPFNADRTIVRMFIWKRCRVNDKFGS